MAPIVTTGGYSVRKIPHTSFLHCGPCSSSLHRSAKNKIELCVSSLCQESCWNCPYQKHQELYVSSLRRGHAKCPSNQ